MKTDSTGTDRQVASNFIVWKDPFKIKQFDLKMVEEEIPSFDFVANFSQDLYH